MTLDLGDFPDFVEAVHGHQPFPWQQALLEAVAEDGIWRDLDVPTGLGKTSLIDVWVFLLAWQIAGGRQRTVPLRLFFAVDRRLVVDQAHEHAVKLAAALADPAALKAVRAVAETLRQAGETDRALETVRMRGGVDWASRWLRSPAQPAVVTCTVDQYGSRLLFRGYGTSPGMRPIDAALCGMDALLAVDEAHLSTPLLTTTAACAAYQATAAHPELARRAVQVVSLSATATADPSRPRHGITDADRHHPIAGTRLNARRRVSLLDARGYAKDPAEAFAAAAVRAMEEMLPLVERPVIGIVGNTIRAARTTHRLLSGRDDIDVLLLVGRCRGGDRERLLAGPLLQELLDGVAPDRTRPLIVVATQTVEVGLDASFAGLITENASLSALVQRLGRLNRTGVLGFAPAVILRADAGKEPDDIPVYGRAAAACWDWLTTTPAPLTTLPDRKSTLQLPLLEGPLFNPTTLPDLLGSTDTAALEMPLPLIPVVHRTLLESWARTSPTPVPDQTPAPFLHGIDTSPEDLQLLWRADLPFRDGLPDWDGWRESLQQIAPHPGETVAVPLRRVHDFLTHETAGVPLSDLEGVPADDEEGTGKPKTKAGGKPISPAMILDPAERTWKPVLTARDLRPGAMVVVPSETGGHDAYGWNSDATSPVADLGDYPHPTRLSPTRLHGPHLALLTGNDAGKQFTATIADAVRRLTAGDDEDPPTRIVNNLLDHLRQQLPDTEPPAAPGHYTDLLHDRLERLATTDSWTLAVRDEDADHVGRAVPHPDDPTRLLLVPARRDTGRTERGLGLTDETADSSSLTLPVTLAQHSKAVGERATDHARDLDLPPTVIDAINTAGTGHDCGKHHKRFQCMLCAGDRLLAESLDKPLAKSGMDPTDRAGRRRAARLARWNPELRHEALSAHAVRTWLTQHPAPAEVDEDLIVHLVAAHHGNARPLLPPVADPEPVDVTCTMPDGREITVNSAAMGADWDGPDRFTTLNQRYGPWGLALLETIVRLADMSCSEEGT